MVQDASALPLESTDTAAELGSCRVANVVGADQLAAWAGDAHKKGASEQSKTPSAKTWRGHVADFFKPLPGTAMRKPTLTTAPSLVNHPVGPKRSVRIC